MKKSLIALTAAAVFAGSALALSGCNNKKTQNIAALDSNWYSFVTYKDIQPTFIGEENAEKLEYSVKFTKPSASPANYSVSYGQGSYSTLFYATEFDRSHVHGEHAESYEKMTAGTVVYYYKTELKTKPTFTYGKEVSDEFSDSVISSCYFLSVGEKLRPLYSELDIVSHTPANYRASSLATAYATMNRVYKNYYNYGGSAVITEYTLRDGDRDFKQSGGNDKTLKVGGLSGSSNILFDLNSLDIAVRAMNLGESLSQPISLYTVSDRVQNYSLKGESVSLTGEERDGFTQILKGAELYNKPQDDEKGLQTINVNVSYSGDLKGVVQTYTFAAVENKKNNVSRATMLKKSTPLAYGLGTLEYSLERINSTLWNE